MFDQAIARTGIRYGVMGALVSFALLVLIYFTGGEPYGENRLYSLVFIPIFIFFGISYFKRFNDTEIGFLKAFRVGLSVSFFAALTAAMLLYVFTYIAGPEALQNYINSIKAMMEATRTETINIIGESQYNQAYALADKTSPADLALDEFMKKFFVGIIASVIGAIFFRK